MFCAEILTFSLFIFVFHLLLLFKFQLLTLLFFWPFSSNLSLFSWKIVYKYQTMLQSCMVNSKISHKFSVYFPHDFCCFLRKMAAISKQNLSKQIVAYGPCARFDCFYVPDHHVSVSPKAARVAGGPSVQVPFWAILTGHPFFPFLRNFEAQTLAGFPVLRVRPF